MEAGVRSEVGFDVNVVIAGALDLVASVIDRTC